MERAVSNPALGAGAGLTAFRARTVIALIGVAVVAALGFAALFSFAPDIRASRDPGAHALSRSAVGYAGLVRLLKETGRPVLVSRSPQGAGGDARAALLVLTPPPGADPVQIDALIAHARTVLILAPKWASMPDPLHPGWSINPYLVPDAMVRIGRRKDLLGVDRAKGSAAPVLTPPATPRAPEAEQTLFAAGTTLSFGPVDQLQTRAQGSASSELVDQNQAPVLLHAKGEVYVLTDPDLINNHGLASLDSARAALLLIDALRGGEGPVVFDVTLNGLRRTRSLFQLALEPPFLAASLCILAASLLMGWRAAASFGAVERRGRALALGKRALVDSSAGLIRLARREPQMTPRYAALIRSQTLAAAGVREQAGEAADAYLERLARSGGVEPFSRLAEEAGQTRTSATLMRVASALYHWKAEVMRERR